jgi:BirA family biotin operon repressor/biotin-[acetyl-CoA-carboxylase] ligase
VNGLPSLRSRLEADERPWPAPIEHHGLIASTSDRLKELARGGAPEWTVVTADAQTAGRGRQGNAWASPRGNLHLSVLLRPSAAPGLVPLVAGVAVGEALVSLGAAGARLKWPNDVLVDDRKLAGLLAEASSGSQGIEWVVLGIGVNVDPVAVGPGPPPIDAVPGLPAGAVTLREAAGREVDLAEVAAAVLRHLTVWYHRAARGHGDDVRAAWRAAAVPWWGHPVEARSGEQVIQGIAMDIDAQGALLLRGDNGRVVPVLAGEVSRVRLAPDAPGE